MFALVNLRHESLIKPLYCTCASQIRAVGHLMMEIGLTMQSEGHELESIAFQNNVWRMPQKTAKDFVIRVKRLYTRNTRVQKSGQKRHGDVADGVQRKESRTILEGEA